MSVGIEAMFTAALGLQAPWEVAKVELSVGKRRIDFDLECRAKQLTCPACGATGQGVHDRVKKQWRHLDFFQFEAWLHAQVPRVACTLCGATSQVLVPWAREGSGFTLLFEALALSMCKELPVAHVARHLRTTGKRLWNRLKFYVSQARSKDDMSGVRHIGIDETSVKKGHQYITVVHDLQAKRLLFGTAGRDHACVQAFAKDLEEHGGKVEQIEHICMDMSTAFIKGAKLELPQAQVSFDRFHVVALASQAMDEVRRQEMKSQGAQVRQAMSGADRKTLKRLFWAMRRNPATWSAKQSQCMHTLQRSNLQSARAWRLKMALREVYAQADQSNDKNIATSALKSWVSWAKRSRLEPFKKVAKTIESHWQGVIAGMLDGRSNAYVEAMNGLLQQAKTAARGFRTVENFLAVAYLRMSKLKDLPVNPLAPAMDRMYGVTVIRV